MTTTPTKERSEYSPSLFLPAAKPSGPRTVRVVVVGGGGVVGGAVY